MLPSKIYYAEEARNCRQMSDSNFGSNILGSKLSHGYLVHALTCFVPEMSGCSCVCDVNSNDVFRNKSKSLIVVRTRRLVKKTGHLYDLLWCTTRNVSIILSNRNNILPGNVMETGNVMEKD